ncbi:UpxY family transcription antiterminator [Salegentibacter sp. F188]|uniref:UpxY family transcription antiterminator n=1 Tax=Autumnicola patrickiae TaxID=3075591 RepID=A0ABU3E4E1_9FLAO|nr:UpxY family transcription antiterminator [Salegentibacter sp. F188]MDT0690797.1 UpxY family transcription antiterminator [Salegentibacter sp. F188]
MQWYVLYTKPKWELKVFENLQKKNIRAYCPTITEVKQWSDRKKKITVPLFRSYLFVHLAEKDRNNVFDVPGVVRYLYWLGKPAIVRDAEIDTIRDWLDDEKVDEVKVEAISVGDNVKISQGAFKDQEAFIKEIGKKYMRLLLPSMGCIVTAKISDVV